MAEKFNPIITAHMETKGLDTGRMRNWYDAEKVAHGINNEIDLWSNNENGPPIDSDKIPGLARDAEVRILIEEQIDQQLKYTLKAPKGLSALITELALSSVKDPFGLSTLESLQPYIQEAREIATQYDDLHKKAATIAQAILEGKRAS